MDSTISRLLRESNPQSGQLASPIPQYYDKGKGGPVRVEGEHGAPFAKLLGPDGTPISASNRLPVSDADTVAKLEQVRDILDSGDLATDTKLEQARALLQS